MELHPFRRERLLRGLTQQQCSQKTGISQSKISLIEQGFVLPTTEDARRLAGVVRRDAADLFPVTREVPGHNRARRSGKGR